MAFDWETIARMRAAARRDRAEAEEHERANRQDAAENCRARAKALEDKADRAEARYATEAHR